MTSDPLIEGLLTIMESEGGDIDQRNLIHSNMEMTCNNGRVTPEQWNDVPDEEFSDNASSDDEFGGIIPIFQGHDGWENLKKMFETV